jgi:hypothetical protein
MVGNAILLIYRAPKSRTACHFTAAIGMRSLLQTTPQGSPISTRRQAASWAVASTILGVRRKLVPEPTAAS